MRWPWSKQEPPPARKEKTALELIETQLSRLHGHVDDIGVRGAPDWLVAEISKFNTALIQRVSEERIAKMIVEDDDDATDKRT